MLEAGCVELNTHYCIPEIFTASGSASLPEISEDRVFYQALVTVNSPRRQNIFNACSVTETRSLFFGLTKVIEASKTR